MASTILAIQSSRQIRNSFGSIRRFISARARRGSSSASRDELLSSRSTFIERSYSRELTCIPSIVDIKRLQPLSSYYRQLLTPESAFKNGRAEACGKQEKRVPSTYPVMQSGIFRDNKRLRSNALVDSILVMSARDYFSQKIIKL